jgi:hypothetical protein
VKITIRKIASLLLFAAAPLAFAQRGGGGSEPIAHPYVPVHEQRLNATADQRAGIAKCLEAMERVRQTAGKMPRIGSFWSRSRRTYSARDLTALSDLSEQFETAVADLVETHHKFVEELTDRQASELKRRLKKLDQLEAKMNSGAAQLNRDLAVAKPGPFSPDISWDVDSIKRATDKWRSEHRKIAKEMEIRQ